MEFLAENAWLIREVEKCNNTLSQELEKEKLPEIKNILHHYYFKGKKLRPAITCLCAKLNGKSSENVPVLAAAIELIHIASLFHDDVVDDTAIRRNEKSSKSKYGNIISFYFGDYALCQGLKIIDNHGNSIIKEVYLATIQNMVRGELLAAANRFNYTITKDVYLQIISLKTASLFQLSSLIGFLSSGLQANKHNFTNIKEVGLNLGIAYQIMDDLEDMIGFGEKDSDLNQGYFSLPFILFINHSNSGFAINGKLSTNQKKEIINCLASNKYFDSVLDDIRWYLEKSKSLLDTFNNQRITGIFNLIGDEIIKKGENAVERYVKHVTQL